jgi:DNA-directed RNA polymerase subunit RPC12/RpoP
MACESGNESQDIRCPECGRIPHGLACPFCGHRHAASVRIVRRLTGRLCASTHAAYSLRRLWPRYTAMPRSRSVVSHPSRAWNISSPPGGDPI